MDREPICYQIGHYNGNKVLDFLKPYEKRQEHMQRERELFIRFYPQVQTLFQKILTSSYRKRHESKEALGRSVQGRPEILYSNYSDVFHIPEDKPKL